jgi:hypothetical protein
MRAKAWLAIACLVAGIPLAAIGLAGGSLLLALPGLALILAFWFLAWQWISGANKPPTVLKPAADAAWRLKDEPVAAPRPGPDAPSRRDEVKP